MSGHIAPNTTPGPWHVFDTGYQSDVPGWPHYSIGIEEFETHAEVRPGCGEVLEAGADMEANAHLIAAAPLMYEALANLENDDGKNMPDTAWQLIQDALKAARGEVRS